MSQEELSSSEPVMVPYDEIGYVVTARRMESPRFDKSLYEMPEYRRPMPANTCGDFTVFGTRQEAEKARLRVPSPEHWEVIPILMRFATPNDEIE